MTPGHPFKLIFLWFFSQDIIRYLLFAVVMTLAIVAGMISMLRRD